MLFEVAAAELLHGRSGARGMHIASRITAVENLAQHRSRLRSCLLRSEEGSVRSDHCAALPSTLGAVLHDVHAPARGVDAHTEAWELLIPKEDFGARRRLSGLYEALCEFRHWVFLPTVSGSVRKLTGSNRKQTPAQLGAFGDASLSELVICYTI